MGFLGGGWGRVKIASVGAPQEIPPQFHKGAALKPPNELSNQV